MAALTEAGWTQYQWFVDRSYTPDVKRHEAADDCRVGTIKYDGKNYVVGIVSKDAIVLGGKSHNPCQDLSLGFGSLAPGESAEVNAIWWFVEGDLGDFAAHTNLSEILEK